MSANPTQPTVDRRRPAIFNPTTRTLLASALVLSFSGCASETLVGRPDLTIVKSEALPEPTASDMMVNAVPFRIGPSDKLAIDVFGIAEASRELTVDPMGQISVPLAGSIHAAGLTPSELADLVTQRLRANYVRDPRVTVNMVEILSQTIAIEGAVTTPGIYPTGLRMTLLRAVARAQGTTEYAKENYVVVFRTVDNKRMAALYDLRAIRTGVSDDPQLYSNDVVVVGESRARRIFKDVLAASPLIATPLVTLLR